MNEHFVANRGSSLYAEDKGGNLMSDGSAKTPEKDRQEHVRGIVAARKISGQVAVSLESVDKLKQGFKAAGEVSSKVDRMTDAEVHAKALMQEGLDQEEAEAIAKGVKVLAEEKKFRELARGKGVQVIGDKENPSVIIETIRRAEYGKRHEAQALLRVKGVDVELPDEKTWESWAIIKREKWLREKGIYQFANWEGVDAGGAYAEGKIPAIAGGSGEIDWEDVTKEIFVEEVEDENGNITGSEPKPRNISLEGAIKRLVKLQEMVLLPQDAETQKKIKDDLVKLESHLKLNWIDPAETAISGKKNFHLVSDLARVSYNLSKQYELAGKAEAFEKVLPLVKREDFKNAKRKLDKSFRDKLEADPQRYRELFKRMDEAAFQVIQVQKSGLYGNASTYRRNFRIVAEREIEGAVSEDEREMLRWRMVTSQEGFDLNYGEIQIQQPTADWRDSEQNLDRILRMLESTDFDEQQLSGALSSAAGIVQSIPINSLTGEERKEAEQKQKELTEKIQAVLAINQFHATMELADMKPDEVMKALGHLKDHTFQLYFERFSKDAKGHEFAQIKKADGKTSKLNLLDVGMNIYMKRLNRERKVMNFVEKWTKDGGVKTGKAEAGVEDECEAARVFLAKNLKSRNVGDVKQVVLEWYQTHTLVGTSNEHSGNPDVEATLIARKKEMIGDKKMFETKTDKEKADLDGRLWDGGLIEELRDHKVEWLLSDKEREGSKEEVEKRADDKIKELIDTGLIDQVMNNAHKLSWMMAWSDYDGIRIHDPNEFEYEGKKQIGAYVYNQSTHMFHGRMLDHAWEFLVDEGRGRVPKTNLLMQSQMLGERGNLLPQNRSMVRFAEALLGEDQVKEWFKKEKGGLKNIGKLDVDNNKEEAGWTKSAILSELIDNGEISFENANWSEFFQEKGSWKYKFIDLYGDRTAMMKYMDRGALQKYLQTPNSELFLQINSIDNFYSGREVRLQPWMKLAIPAHLKTGDYWKKWWGLSYRMTHSEKEDVIEVSANTNRLDAKYKDSMKRDNLGWGGMPGVMPVRNVRQLAEAADIAVRVGSTESVKSSWRVPFAVGGEFWKQGIKYMFS